MKRILTLLLAAGAMASASAQVGVSIGINQPGVYGRINIGVPAPALVLSTPVIISPPRVAINRAPIYLYVPPEHQRDWGRYCGRYGACGQPVYFVRDDWVRERYTHDHPGWDRGHRGPDWHGDRRDDRHDGRRDGHDHDHDRDRRN
jgi:hypothetical protein